MNAKQIKRARAVAYREAKKRELWKQGENSPFFTWWRKLLAKIFPKIRKRYTDAVARWYKANLKLWAHRVCSSIHDRDYQAMQAAKRKMERERRKSAIAKRKGVIASRESGSALQPGG